MTARISKRHGEERRRLRRRLEAASVPQATIDRRVDQLRRRQEAARRAGVAVRDLDALHDQTWAELTPDDAGYQPNPGDPLQRGAARVSDITAQAARRRKAMTRYEYDREQPGDPAA